MRIRLASELYSVKSHIPLR